MKKALLILVAILSIISMSSCIGSSTNDSPETSSGYKEGFEPTVNENGKYHTINGDGKQIEYQGSQEQKKDLEAIDAQMKENPNF